MHVVLIYVMNIDNLIIASDCALRTLFAQPHAARPLPQASQIQIPLSEKDCSQSVELMRVNHVGEVCAQALYSGQILATKNPTLKQLFDQAGREEVDHLAWCKTRLDQLQGRPSMLNPIWYLGAFVMGYAAGKLGGDACSLGFVAETELQVEQHLDDHLTRLPAADHASRAILTQMKQDEIAHGAAAEMAGAAALPEGVRKAMRAVSKIMTTVALKI